MDPQVTCPRCQQRQALPSPDGYRCTSCGARWVFVSCRSCRERFHMDPGTRSWDCPSCGVRNGPATPASASASASAASTPKLQRRRRSPFTGSERIPLIAVVVAAVVVIALVWWHFGGGSNTPSVTSPTPGTALTAAQALTKLCTDIPIDQNQRVGALRATEDLVRPDAEALRKAGDLATSHKAVAVANAMEALAVALGSQGDTSAANAQLSTAMEAVSAACQAG